MKQRVRLACAFLMALGLFVILLVSPAKAAREDCNVKVGKKVPVLLVHGFKSGFAIWGANDDAGFRRAIKLGLKLPTYAFDYERYSLQWVTHPQIGKALANRIICLADSSRKGGGNGKVVVVAHSMGGLATRQAIAEDSRVAKALGLVVTIATPNYGSDVDHSLTNTAWQICTLSIPIAGGCRTSIKGTLEALTALPGLAAGSKEIRQLPAWPRSVPVHSIGGNIALRYKLFDLPLDGPHTGSDALVTLQSALVGHKVNGLGGTSELRCYGEPPPLFPSHTRGPCEHSALVQNETAQKLVVEQIKKYVRSTVAPNRTLPEACTPTVSYQGPGFTLRANTQVMSGTVSCKAALVVAQSFLEESGPDPVTKVGQWTCRVTSSNPSGGFIAECTSSEGKIRLDGE